MEKQWKQEEFTAEDGSRAAIVTTGRSGVEVCFGRWGKDLAGGDYFFVSHAQPSRGYTTHKGAMRAVNKWISN